MAEVSERAYRSVLRLLSALPLLSLERCTHNADEWRSSIHEAQDDLALWWLETQHRELEFSDLATKEVAPTLPPDDPIRVGKDGKLLSDDELSQKLQDIIDSWPSWEKEKKKRARK